MVVEAAGPRVGNGLAEVWHILHREARHPGADGGSNLSGGEADGVEVVRAGGQARWIRLHHLNDALDVSFDGGVRELKREES